MSTVDPGPAVHPSVPQAGAMHKFMHIDFWIRELPFSLVLILTMVGVAYTSFSKQPITGYWEILTPLIALVCVGAGWDERDRQLGAISTDSERKRCTGWRFSW